MDALKVGDIHDEAQWDVEPKDAEEFGKAAIAALLEAGEFFNLRVPLLGEFKIGENWSKTH